MKIARIALLCFAFQPLAAQTSPGKVVHVSVINSVTRAPIARCNVILTGGADENVFGRTDAAGVFVGHIKSPSPLLNVTRRGYRVTDHGAGRMVTVDAASQTNVIVEMLPLGVVAGRAIDQYGDSIRHAVVAIEDLITVGGIAPVFRRGSAAVTDDLGEYRLSEIEPGKHFVALEYSSKHAAMMHGNQSRLDWPETGGVILYPDATDIGQAQQIEVGAGETLRLKDIRLNIQTTVTISGRITPPPTNTRQAMDLQRVNGLELSTIPTFQSVDPKADGSFKVDVLPGKYALNAHDTTTGKMAKPIALEVRDRNITGLNLELTTGYEINGRIVIEGNQTLDFSKLLFNLGGPKITIDQNGTFQTNLFGTQGVYTLQNLPENWYVKNVSVAGRPIAGRIMQVEAGTTDVQFTLSPSGARLTVSLSGTVNNLEAASVLLLPENGGPPDPEMTLHAEINGSGNFQFMAVPPGRYRAFTLGVSNWMLLMTPQVLLEKYGKEALLITVTEGEKTSIVLPFREIKVE